MDATTLRIVLFVVGLIFLGGIYLYETRRRKRESAQARRRITPQVDHRMQMPAEEDLAEYETPYIEAPSDAHGDLDESTELLDEEDAQAEAEMEMEDFRIDDAPIPGIDTRPPVEEVSGLERDTEPASETSMEQQELFGFSAHEESPVDVPDLIIQINVRAKPERLFAGPAIEQAMQETGLDRAASGIYQRASSDGSDEFLYHLASMVEPGIFPQAMADFTTPGLTLFTQLPAHRDGLMIFSDMLYTAERLAAMLDGDLQDETHSALTKQTMEHLRERIMEHKRQIQLARRKG
jgi:cell division protein ZipA